MTDQAMAAGTKPRSRAITILAVFAGSGAVLGILAGMWFISAQLGIAWWVLPASLGVLALSVAELVFAYGLWTLVPWALKPWQRAIALVVAIVLIVLGAYVSYAIPVRTIPRLEH
ncbi:MAG: hypothetical protein ACRDF7_07420 [Candidatus Limnocylindrales bacterium]